mgnify:CR=1 FL=1
MIIKVRVIPNAKRNEVISRIGTILKINLMCSAFSGATNQMLLTYLAEFFGVDRSCIFLRKGNRGREKTIELCGENEEKLKEVLDRIP